MNLDTALAQATYIHDLLAPHCHECVIAGSIRRRKPDNIKDVEIVLIPKNTDLVRLAEIINGSWGRPIAGMWPSKYTKIRGRFNLDIFTCTPETFGLNLFIRTGPDTYGQRMLSHWKTITNGGYSEGAQLHRADGTIVPTPTEQSVFDALRLPFLPPEKRL